MTEHPDLEGAWLRYLVNQQSVNGSKRNYVYASGRRSCLRAMALDMDHPEDRNPADGDGMERMLRGKEREEAIVGRLMHVGKICEPPFEVIAGQAAFKTHDRDGRLLISGKVDARLKFSNDLKPVVEVKTGRTFENVTCLEDLDHSPWSRHTLDQLLNYLLGAAERWGILVIDRPGMPVFLWVDLEEHLDRAERFLKDAREAIDSLDHGILPEMTQDRAECKRCDHFGKSCAPPMDYGPGAIIFTDPELIQAAAAVVANQEAAKAYDRAHDRLKKAVRGVEIGLLGEYQISGKWQKSTSYQVPDDVKAKYKVVTDKGRYLFEVEKI